MPRCRLRTFRNTAHVRRFVLAPRKVSIQVVSTDPHERLPFYAATLTEALLMLETGVGSAVVIEEVVNERSWLLGDEETAHSTRSSPTWSELSIQKTSGGFVISRASVAPHYLHPDLVVDYTDNETGVVSGMMRCEIIDKELPMR
jgi:hypothetical protein